ncbi:hypothetical protein [Moritella marina]|uniref:hypothetical protein n=1 Tax=Moritella marina TaxID=90736 RepID=UPI0037038CE2
MNRKMESTYFIVPDHVAQSSSLSDAAFRLLVWMLCKKNKDRIADFSRFSLQSDKQHSITELINKNYLQQDDSGLYINSAIMYEKTLKNSFQRLLKWLILACNISNKYLI